MDSQLAKDRNKPVKNSI